MSDEPPGHDADRPAVILRRHPVRGLFSGFVFGVGAALLLIAHAQAPFGALTPYVVPVLCAVIAMLGAILIPGRSRSRRHAVARRVTRTRATRHADAAGSDPPAVP